MGQSPPTAPDTRGTAGQISVQGQMGSRCQVLPVETSGHTVPPAFSSPPHQHQAGHRLHPFRPASWMGGLSCHIHPVLRRAPLLVECSAVILKFLIVFE